MNSRERLVAVVTFLSGLYFVLEFLTPHTLLQNAKIADYNDLITNWFVTVGTMALGLGVINLCLVHGLRLIYLRSDWFYSLVLLTSMLLMITVSFAEWFVNSSSSVPQEETAFIADFAEDILNQLTDHKTASKHPELGLLEPKIRVAALVKKSLEIADKYDQPALSALSSSIRTTCQSLIEANNVLLAPLKKLAKDLRQLGLNAQEIYRERAEQSTVVKLNSFLIDGLFNSLGAAMFSLLSVYIASAAFKAFRVRTFESGLMMSAAVVVILGQTTFGLYISPYLPEMRQWLLEVPNAAAFRAIKFGSSIAGLVISFRIWFSIESRSFLD